MIYYYIIKKASLHSGNIVRVILCVLCIPAPSVMLFLMIL